MNHSVIILQKSPRIDISFFENQFEITKSNSVLVGKTEYSKMKSVEFKKGKIPWLVGILTSLFELITNVGGGGYWKRGKGELIINTNDHNYSIELVNYDREQTPAAVEKLKAKFK